VRSKREGRRVRSALIAALVVVTAACARPTSTVQQPTPTPIPSPSPTPTTPLALTATAPFHTGEVGVAYASVGLSATGGVQPYTWSVASGALPNGLSIGSDGTVSGTPTGAGTFAFTVQVADAGNSTATIPGSVPIAAALSASLIPDCATQCSVEVGCSVCGSFGQQGGGVGPYSYTLTSGQLPAGTSLSGLSLSGTFAGLSGYLLFTVQVTDSLGASAAVTPKFWLYDHISLASAATCGPIYFRIGCRTSLPYSGGILSGPPSVTITGAQGTLCSYTPAGALTCSTTTSVPAGFTAVAGGGVVSVSVAGDPNGAYHTYKGTVTLVIQDQGLCGRGSYCQSGVAVVTVDLNGG
jgi:putative Ig domain-containing protein